MEVVTLDQHRLDIASLERRIHRLEMAGGREIEKYYGHQPSPNRDACAACGLHGLFWSRHAKHPVPCPASR